MNLSLLLYPVLAIITNAIIPVPFEPVLLYYFSNFPEYAHLLVIGGALCASIAAILDVFITGKIGNRLERKFALVRAPAMPIFYLGVFLFAAFPLPFSAIRAAMVKYRPRRFYYATIVFFGRLLRYWLIAGVIRSSNISVAAAVIAVMLIISFGVKRYCFALTNTRDSVSSTTEVTKSQFFIIRLLRDLRGDSSRASV